MTRATLATPDPITSPAPNPSPAAEDFTQSPAWTPELRAAWTRIQSHPIGPSPATRGIVTRIAREHGWSRLKTDRAIEAYRRFCLLAVDRRGAVSPSDPVDAVWHTHLLYTTDYWNHFCPNVLAFPLHHVPNSGATGEGARLTDLYSQTLTRYTELFGQPPPQDLWPPPGTPHQHHLTVDPAQYWLLPKLPRWVLVIVGITILTIFALLSAGAGPAGSGATKEVQMISTSATMSPVSWPLADASVFDFTGTQFLWFYAIAYVVVLAAGLVLRWQAGRSTRFTPAGFLPEPYEAAYLSGGSSLALSAAIASLAARGEIITDNPPGSFELPKSAPPPRKRHPLESAVLMAIGHTTVTLRQIQQRTTDALADVRAGLADAGLVPETSRETTLRTMAILLGLAVPAIGVIKIFVGLSRDKPVSFLVMMVLATTVISLFAFCRKIRMTTEGQAAMARLRAQTNRNAVMQEAQWVATAGQYDPTPVLAGGPVMSSDSTSRFNRPAQAAPLGQAAPFGQPATAMPLSSAGIDPLVFAMALYGTGVLDGTPLAPLRSNLDRQTGSDGSLSTTSSGCSSSTDTTSSDSGSSDSGGGSDGGSGCGGCGGGGD